MEGTQIGSYRIERTLGTGGFGVVYVGVDVRLGRRAAIKQLLPELSGNREIVERFFNEAKAAASINHPGIVEIYDVGWHTDGSAYFTMKLLDGDSLGKRLQTTGPMQVQLAATIARQVSSAVAAAHARGIVHRDLKPDNVVLVPDDEVAIGERATVLDFGIAKLFGNRPGEQKTRTGMMMGTPAYMSPEQCRGAGEVNHSTDVYALGCILFEMLTGQPPFVGEGPGEVLGKHQFVAAPMLRSLRPDVPPELEAVVMRTLAKNPTERFRQMSELTAALQPFAIGGRSMERPASHVPPQRPVSEPGAPAAPTPRFAVAGSASQRRDATPPAAVHALPSTLVTSPAGQPSAARSGRRGVVIGVSAVLVSGIAITLAVALSSGPAEQPVAAPADAVIGSHPAATAIARTGDDAAVVARTDVDAAVSVPPIHDAAAPAAPAGAGVVGGELGAPSLPPRSVPRPQIVPPTLLERNRIRGDKNVVPDDATKAAIARSGKDKVVGSYKLCLDEDGAAVSILQLKTTGFPDYDAKIQTEMRHWAYRPFLVDGKAVPVCTAVSFIYSQAAPPSTSQCNPDESMVKGDQLVSSGQHAAALAMYERALKCKPDERALAKAYMSACNSRNAAKAKTYFKQLSPARQAPLSQVCVRNGLSLE